MANLSSIARPYALAAFDCARDKQQLPLWKAFLETASHIATEPAVVRLLINPEVSSAKIYDLFHGVLASMLGTEKHPQKELNNFLMLLAKNERLDVIPEISELFNSYYAALEKISNVRVITAVEPKEEFRKKLIQSLTKKIQREVTLECEIDPSIIGGAVIHIGDRVIDGSIRGKLARLLERLTG